FAVHGHPRVRRPFPTRRSSDLVPVGPRVPRPTTWAPARRGAGHRLPRYRRHHGVVMSVHAHRWTGALAGLAAATLLAACSTGSGSGSPSPSGSEPANATASAAPVAEDAFPVTVTSSLGDAVIEAKPERVVTLGWGADDIALQLGTVPVGVEADTWSGD